MGVSTLASYRNSHLFEIVGLSDDLCAQFFEDAADYPGQKSLDDLLSDYLRMHKAAFSGESDDLPDSGLYRFRKRRRTSRQFSLSCSPPSRSCARPR